MSISHPEQPTSMLSLGGMSRSLSDNPKPLGQIARLVDNASSTRLRSCGLPCRVMLGILALLLLAPAWCGAQIIRPVPYVIHVSVDGLAALYLRDYVSNAPAQFPNFTRLMTQGAFTFNARCDFDKSSTIPNHASIFTGRPIYQPEGQPATIHHGYDNDSGGADETLHANGNPNVPYKYSVFDVVHDHGLSTAFFSGKPKFALFTRSYDENNGAPDTIGEDNGRNKVDFAMLNDSYTNGPDLLYETTWELVDVLVAQMTNAPWNYTFLHFAETDYVGHTFTLGPWGSPAWSNTVRYVDGQLGRLLGAIDSTPGLSNHTALIVTADHGGGGNHFGGFSHDDPLVPVNYTIPLFFWGPGVPAAANLYDLLPNRGDPGEERPDFNAVPQPIRCGDSGNLALALLGLPSIPGSIMVPQLDPLGYPLKVVREGTRLSVSWPVGAEDYVLEWAETVLPANAWHAVTDGITLRGPFKVWIVPGSDREQARFFRLRKTGVASVP